MIRNSTCKPERRELSAGVRQQNEDVPRYENIEVCAYRKIIEDSEATIMEE